MTPLGHGPERLGTESKSSSAVAPTVYVGKDWVEVSIAAVARIWACKSILLDGRRKGSEEAPEGERLV